MENGVYLYDAMQRPDGRWDFCRRAVSGLRAPEPVGYCGRGHHATRAEAFVCYTGFLLDTTLRLHVRTLQPHVCAAPECSTPTGEGAEIDGELYYLCTAHMTRAEVARMFGVTDQFFEVSP